MRILSNLFEQELIQGKIAEGKDSAKDSTKGPTVGLFQMPELSAFKLMEGIHEFLLGIHYERTVSCNWF